MSKEPTQEAAAMPRFPATHRVSVRKQVMLWAVAVPLVFLASELVVAALTLDWLDGVEKRRGLMETNYNKLVTEFGQKEERRKSLLPIAQKLGATPSQILVRMSALADDLSLTPELMTDKVAGSDLVTARPMNPRAVGISVKLRGSPERLQQFFWSIENQFPQLTTMSVAVEVSDGVLRYATTYLVADYASTAK